MSSLLGVIIVADCHNVLKSKEAEKMINLEKEIEV